MKIAIGLLIAICAAWGQRPGAIDSTVANVANLPAQKIQPNDLIAVSVYGEPDLTRTVRVAEDGSIDMPMLDARLPAAGLQPSDLAMGIAKALREGRILIKPVVTVTLLEYSTNRTVSVMGAVRRPLTFQVVGTVRLLDALAKAEGLSPDAGPEVLVSGTGDDAPHRIRLQELMNYADPKLNFVLTGGEEIRVPEAGKIYVVGNVKKPGALPVRDGTENSVLKVLAMVEGVSPYATKQAYIYRSDGDGRPRTEIPIELNKILKRKAPDVALMADDILYIPDATGKRIGVTTLEKIAGFGGGAATAVIYAGAR